MGTFVLLNVIIATIKYLIEFKCKYKNHLYLLLQNACLLHSALKWWITNLLHEYAQNERRHDTKCLN
jgi:hypothetical protein